MSSGIGVEDRCVEVYQDLKLKKKYKFIIYRIKDDFSQIYVDKVAESGSYEEFVKSLPANECRYAVYDFEYEKGNEGVRNKICFYAWAPEDSKIKNKMIYASSKDAIRKKLVGIASEIQATDFAEVAYDTILEKVSKSVVSV